MLRPTGRRARLSQHSRVRGGVKKRPGALGGGVSFLCKPADEAKAKSYRLAGMALPSTAYENT